MVYMRMWFMYVMICQNLSGKFKSNLLVITLEFKEWDRCAFKTDNVKLLNWHNITA